MINPSAKNKGVMLIRPYICPALGSFSQFNEDLLIDLLFLSKEKGFYIDIGANDPEFNSNTKRFYDKGWSGINIDPGVDFSKKFSSLRRRDINLNIGIGPSKGKMIFYQVMGDSTLSSFNKEVAEKMAKLYELKVSELEVEVLRIADVCEEYVKSGHIDLMSIDAEGLDLEVLKSNDWHKFRPSLLMIEIDSQYGEIVEYMARHSYLLIFNNYHNAIFLDKDTSESSLRTIVKREK
jgi:FkbM family methyltransferase